MRAILIDPAHRVVRGIEVAPDTLDKAFIDAKTSIPVDMTGFALNATAMLFYDRNGVLKHPADFFHIEGYTGPVFGKGILMAHKQGYGPLGIETPSAEVEAIVGFHMLARHECPTCHSKGFEPSVLDPTRCTFCDGTDSGNPPTQED